MRLSLACALSVAVCAVGRAQEVEIPDLRREVYPPLRMSLYWENDSRVFTFFDSSDRHYTNGAKLAFTWGDEWVDDLAGAIPFRPGGDGQRAAFGVSLAQHIYTPDFVDNPALRPPVDRRFAGWLYGSVFVQRRAGQTFDEVGLNVGVIGENSMAEPAQKWVHQIIGDPEPIGWDTQLGSEWGVDLTYRRVWRLGPNVGRDTARDALDFQALPAVSFALGTINRRANGDLTLRIGMNLPDDFGPARLAAVADGTGRARDGFGWSLFVRAGGSLVQHDRFLSDLDVEPVRGEVQVGLTLSWGPVELGYSQTWLTKDYEEQPESDRFGAWTLAARFTF